MRWLKYIVIGLTSLVIVSIAIVVTLALLLEQDEFRDGLVYVVNRTTDHRLEINGPLEIDFSLSPLIKVADISFKTADDGFEMNAAEFRIKIDIKPLLSKHLVVREFLLKDSSVNIRQLPDAGEEDEPFEPFQIRAPIIEKLSVGNLDINYWQLDETVPLNIHLDSLQKDYEAGAELITLKGAGTIDGTAFKVEGESDAVAILLTSNQPFSFRYHFDVMQSSIHAEGRISNPHETRDLDIGLQIEAPDVQDILQLLHVNAPDIGRLAATGRVAGTLDAPRLEDIELELSKDKVALQVSGAVGNLQSTPELDLEFSSSISDAKVLAKLLADLPVDQLPTLDSLQSSGKFSGSTGNLSLDDYTLEASGPQGHKLKVTGRARFVAALQPLRDLDATVAIASPDTKFVRQFAEAVPLMSPLSASAHLSMDSDVLVITDLKLKAGNNKTGQIEGQGGIGHISFTPTVDVANIDLKVNVSGASSRAIGDLVKISLPEMGPVKASGRYSGSIASSAVKGLQVQVGTAEQLLIDARGDIKLAALDGDKPLAGLVLDININAPGTESLSAIASTEIPALGRLKGTAHVGDANGLIAITALDLKIDKGNDFQLALSGTLADLEKQTGLDMQLELSASDLNSIGQLFDKPLPKEGPLKYSARLKGGREKLYHNGRANLRNTTITTDLTTSFTGDRPRLAGSITIPDLDLHDIGIYPEKRKTPAGTTAPREFDAVASQQAAEVEDLFSKEPIDFSGLQAIDLDLEVRIAKLTSTVKPITDIYSHVLLKNGKLDIKPLEYKVDNDVISTAFMIDSSTKPPAASMLVSGDDIDLGLLLANSATNSSPIKGLMTAKVEMKSRGHSPAELAANLDGKINVVTENATIEKSTMNLLTVDVIGWAISNVLSANKDVKIECAIVMMHFDKGMGVTDLYVFDTPDTLIRIDARFNLVDQTMDIAILPEHKVRLFKTKKDPMEIYGPIANPQYKLVSAKDLAQETGRAWVLAPLTISKSLLDNLTDLLVEAEEAQPGSCDKFLK
jgi:uncharacterized protein involved in outer membrane biogenesis